jgi:hypothetical protein
MDSSLGHPGKMQETLHQDSIPPTHSRLHQLPKAQGRILLPNPAHKARRGIREECLLFYKEGLAFPYASHLGGSISRPLGCQEQQSSTNAQSPLCFESPMTKGC